MTTGMLNMIAGGTALISAALWFWAASVRVPNTEDWMIGGVQPWMRKAAILNRWAALFTGLAGLSTGLTVLTS